MSDNDPRQARAEANAEAAAAKARAKAMRPWYRKKRFLFPLALLVVIVLVTVASGGDDKDDTASVSSTGSTARDDRVTSKLSGNDEHKPKDDVTMLSCIPGAYGLAKANLRVVNHSSKRSSYTIELTFERGSVKVGDGSAFLTNVEPGQTAEEEAIGSYSGDGAGVSCRLVNVERFAA